MTTRKKGGRNAVRTRNGKRAQPPVALPSASETADSVAPENQPAPALEDTRPVHVVLDNDIPGGFRMEPV